MRIGIVGVGNMGYAFAKALYTQKLASDSNLYLYQSNVEKAQNLQREGIGKVFTNIDYQIEDCTVILLAVKPQSFVQVAELIRPYVRENQLFISVMAGVKVELITALLGTNRVVRAMPNTPCQLGMGITGFFMPENLSDGALKAVEMILSSTGEAVQVQKEEDIDSVTALSGSGPAYFYYFIKHLVEAGKNMGLSSEVSEKLALQTMLGAHKMMQVSEVDFDDLIAAVRSKGGTTEAALNVMNDKMVGLSVERALMAAKNRATELSDMIAEHIKG